MKDLGAASTTKATHSGRRELLKVGLPPTIIAVRRHLTHVQDDRLLLREVLQHGLERSLLAEAGALDAAIGEVGLDDEVLVDLDEARLEAVHGVERRPEVARPDRRGEAVLAVVGGRDRLLVVAELDDRGDRAEDLLARQAV